MNYMGSKARIAKHIVPIIQKYIDDNGIHNYIEPFCGSCAVIDKIKCDKKFAYDLNKYLIYLFIHLKSGGNLPEVISKDLYDMARKAWHMDNDPKVFEDWMIGCIGWLCSYNGRGFDGGYSYEGDEHRKDGTVIHRNYYQERKNNLLKLIRNNNNLGNKYSIDLYLLNQCKTIYMLDEWNRSNGARAEMKDALMM